MNSGPSAIFVAHPGHEVRIHGWLERERPQVFVLTDGSGRVGQSRIGSTAKYLKKFGLQSGCIFGQLTDLEVYRAILAHDFDLFIGLSEELAEALVADGTRCVTGDATEGYNTAHDAVRLMINTAIEMASRASGVSILNYDFPVVRRSDHCPLPLRPMAIQLHLDDELFSRKLAAAFEFYPELAAETRDILGGNGHGEVVDYYKLNSDEHALTQTTGLDMFRMECLRPVLPAESPFEAEKPYYEQTAENKVATGLYEQVIRYREHMRPLADALAESVERRVRSSASAS
jgi:hypothetical protein